MQDQASESKPEFRNVGENLYRRESSGVYYALVKRAGKQFRRSLKTTDPKFAHRRLNELRDDVAALVSHDAHTVTVETVAERWLAATSHTVKESTQTRRSTCLKALKPFFAGLTLRERHGDALRTLENGARRRDCTADVRARTRHDEGRVQLRPRARNDSPQPGAVHQTEAHPAVGKANSLTRTIRATRRDDPRIRWTANQSGRCQGRR